MTPHNTSAGAVCAATHSGSDHAQGGGVPAVGAAHQSGPRPVMRGNTSLLELPAGAPSRLRRGFSQEVAG